MIIELDDDEYQEFIEYAKSETTEHEKQELKDALDFYDYMTTKNKNKYVKND